MGSKFTDIEGISPFDLVTEKYYAIPEALERSWHYEWNAQEQKWGKLNEDDPDPPASLPNGSFDGQIVEVPRNT